MNKDLLSKRNAAKRAVGDEDYREYSSFCGDIFLSDYDLLVVVARKFSNSYMGMLSLVREDNGGRVGREYDRKFVGRKPFTISDNALPALREDIIGGKYRSILIVDDIVLHGRTLNETYLLVRDWLRKGGVEGAKVDVEAFACYPRGLMELEVKKALRPRRECQTGDQWKQLSDRIVKLMYITEMPYVSYVPVYKVDEDSEEGRAVKQLLESGDQRLSSEAYETMRPYCAGYTTFCEVPAEEAFLSKSIRFYTYASGSKRRYGIVPLVMLNPICEGLLKEYLRRLSPCLADGQEQDAALLDGVYGYRAVVYLISKLWFEQFAEDHLGSAGDGIASKCLSVAVERLNFGRRVSKALSSKAREAVMEAVCRAYRDGDKASDLLREDGSYDQLRSIFDKLLEKMREKGNCGFAEYSDAVRTFLFANGMVDEERTDTSNESIEEAKRLIGYPVAELRQSGVGDISLWTRAVLLAADLGKGSLVPHEGVAKGKKYYVSLLHAGEENYKYLLDDYLCELHGLSCIQQVLSNRSRFDGVSRGTTVSERDIREQFLNRLGDALHEAPYRTWGDKESVFSLFEYLRDLDVQSEYGRLIDERVLERADDDERLDMSSDIVDEVLEENGAYRR